MAERVVHVVDEDGGPVVTALTDADGLTVDRIGTDGIGERIAAADAVVIRDDPPSLDGVETFFAVRSVTSAPTVVVGPDATADRVEAAMRAGITDYVRTVDGPSLAARLRARSDRPALDSYRQAAEWAEFGSGLSHDAKNPLNVVTGRLELLELGEPHEAAIDRSLGRVATLLSELSTVGKLSQPVVDPPATELSATATDSWRQLSTADATLDVTAETTVDADRDRLVELFDRLLTNALDHGGADVAVEVGATERGFYVADDGPGIPSEEREQVFEQGYTTAADHEGYGLYVVRCIADAHGWTVRAVDPDSSGARIEVRTVS